MWIKRWRDTRMNKDRKNSLILLMNLYVDDFNLISISQTTAAIKLIKNILHASINK